MHHNQHHTHALILDCLAAAHCELPHHMDSECGTTISENMEFMTTMLT
jgi:hypothetical protein